jgi:CubicO group peptidase (beta-lactamase class C family)
MSKKLLPLYYQFFLKSLLLFLVVTSASAEESNHTSSDAYKNRKTTLFLEVVNSNDNSNIKTFFNMHLPDDDLNPASIEAHLKFAKDIHKKYGQLTRYTEHNPSEPNLRSTYTAMLKSSRTEQWVNLTLYFSDDEDRKIVRIREKTIFEPSKLLNRNPLSLRRVKNLLSGYVKRMESNGVFSGTVLLAKGDKVIFHHAAGMASKRFGVKNTLDTKFNLGSMNKMFTSVAILQLVEKGKLSVNDTLDLFIDESWLPYEVSNKIQIQHLLTHSSGLGSYFTKEYTETSKLLLRSLSDYKNIISKEELQFEPGSHLRYSNTGMFILGLVIEKASGQDYFDYIRENIYLKAGMTNSDSYEMDQPIPNLAIGYSQAPTNITGWENNLFLLGMKGVPAGGGYSTVSDLHKFALALSQYKLLGKELTEISYSPKMELNSPHYGYGFNINDDPNNRIVGHGGAFSGISANLDIYLDQGYIAVVLSNYSGGSQEVEFKIRELLSQVSDKIDL